MKRFTIFWPEDAHGLIVGISLQLRNWAAEVGIS